MEKTRDLFLCDVYILLALLSSERCFVRDAPTQSGALLDARRVVLDVDVANVHYLVAKPWQVAEVAHDLYCGDHNHQNLFWFSLLSDEDSLSVCIQLTCDQSLNVCHIK